MKTKFSDKGNYVIAIQGLKNEEQIYLDKAYEYEIYYFKTKKSYKEFLESKGTSLSEVVLKEKCNEVLPKYIENMIYFDVKNKVLLNNSDFFNYDPEKQNKKNKGDKFYLTIVKCENVDGLFFFDEKYKQATYEFDTKEELDGFVSRKEYKKENKKFESIVFPIKKQKNIVYLLIDNNYSKVLEHEFILNKKDFNREYDSKIHEFRNITKVIFFPSGDIYAINRHEDAVYEAIQDLSQFKKEEIAIGDFLDATARCSNEKYKFKKQYVGKTIDFNNALNVEDEDICFAFVNTYFKLDYIFTLEELEVLKEKVASEKNPIEVLNKKIKANPDEVVKNAKELLISLEIIDSDGKILEPYTVIFKDDFNVDTNNKGTAKTKKSKKSTN